MLQFLFGIKIGAHAAFEEIYHKELFRGKLPRGISYTLAAIIAVITVPVNVICLVFNLGGIRQKTKDMIMTRRTQEKIDAFIEKHY